MNTENTLLIDLSQILLAPLLVENNSNADENLIKHLAINSIRAHVKKFKEYKNIVLCCDSRNYWRKSIFPYYKANRKENRKKSNLNWDLIFQVINTVKIDLKEHFPYKLVEVERAEADDVIATLTKYLSPASIIILSSDADFKQLHVYENVRQYNPLLDIYVKSKNPVIELKEKVIRGDFNDGVPNVLSSDDMIVSKKRQSPITQKKLDIWIPEQDMTKVLDEEQYKNYCRNNLLINFDFIPEEIKTNIITEYENAKPKTKQDLYKYFVKNQMINLIDCIEDF